VLRRTTQAWEPARIVCKRVNVPDPWAKRPLPADAVRAVLEPKLLSASVAAVTSTRSFTQGSAQQPADEPPAEPIVRPSADIFNAVFGADDSSDEHVIPPPPPTATATRENEFSRHAQPLVPEVRPVTVETTAQTSAGRQPTVSFAQLAESLDSHARPRDVPRRPQALPIDVGGPLMRGADGVMGPMPPPPPTRERQREEKSSSSSSESESESERETRKRKSSKHHHHHRHNSKKSRKSKSKKKH